MLLNGSSSLRGVTFITLKALYEPLNPVCISIIEALKVVRIRIVYVKRHRSVSPAVIVPRTNSEHSCADTGGG